MRRQPRDIVAVEGDAAAGRRQNSGDGVEKRGLAGAVGTDDGAALAARDGEADAIDGAQGVERNDHIGKRQDRFGHGNFRFGDAGTDRVPQRLDQVFLMPWKVRE